MLELTLILLINHGHGVRDPSSHVGLPQHARS